MAQIEREPIKVCSSVDEFNELLSNARPKKSVVIAGMYNSLVGRILIADNKNQCKKFSIIGLLTMRNFENAK